MKRQTHGTLGMAFVFLGLILAPLSLKISGGVVNLDQRLRAVADAWSQVVSVFSGDYPDGTPSQGSALVASMSDQEQPDAAQLQDSSSEASAPAVNELKQTAPPRSPGAGRCPKAASRKINAAVDLKATSRPSSVAQPAPPGASAIKTVFAFEIAKATQLDRATREHRANRVRDELAKYHFELSSAVSVGREVVPPNVMVALGQLPARLSEALKRCASAQRSRARTDRAAEHKPCRVILAAPFSIEFDAADAALDGETPGVEPKPIP